MKRYTPLIIIVCALAVAGVLIAYKPKSYTAPPVPMPIRQGSVPIERSQLPEKNTFGFIRKIDDGWMTYENAQLGFRMEYPVEMRPSESVIDNPFLNSRSHSVNFNGANESFMFITLADTPLRTVDEWFAEEMSHYTFRELGELHYKKIRISDEYAVLTYSAIYDPPHVFADDQMIKGIVLIKNGIQYEIAMRGISAKDYERMLKSFKLIERSGIAPDFSGTARALGDGWVMYENQKIGFRIAYPDRYGAKLEEIPGHGAYQVFFGDRLLSSYVGVLVMQSEIRTVDELISRSLAYEDGGVRIEKRAKIAGHSALMKVWNEGTPDGRKRYEAIFFANGAMFNIVAEGSFSEAELRRIWESFAFAGSADYKTH